MNNNQLKANELSNQLANHLGEHLSTNSNRKIPPLHKWTPTQVTVFDVLIKDNGEWWHGGTKMTRQSLIDLFASVLWGEHDAQGQKQYYLKTPTDKYQITVEDAPLFICDVDSVVKDGVTWLVFYTTNQDLLYLGESTPLYIKTFVKNGISQERFYMDTRFGLTACLLPSVVYRLVELGSLEMIDDKVVLSIQSGHQNYQLVSNFAIDDALL